MDERAAGRALSAPIDIPPRPPSSHLCPSHRHFCEATSRLVPAKNTLSRTIGWQYGWHLALTAPIPCADPRESRLNRKHNRLRSPLVRWPTPPSSMRARTEVGKYRSGSVGPAVPVFDRSPRRELASATRRSINAAR